MEYFLSYLCVCPDDQIRLHPGQQGDRSAELWKENCGRRQRGTGWDRRSHGNATAKSREVREDEGPKKESFKKPFELTLTCAWPNVNSTL